MLDEAPPAQLLVCMSPAKRMPAKPTTPRPKATPKPKSAAPKAVPKVKSKHRAPKRKATKAKKTKAKADARATSPFQSCWNVAPPEKPLLRYDPYKHGAQVLLFFPRGPTSSGAVSNGAAPDLELSQASAPHHI